MKRYHEAFHFRNENGEVTGAYLYDTKEQKGFPVNMADFQKLVASSEVMFLECRDGDIIRKMNEEERKFSEKMPKFGESIQEYWDNDGWTEERFFSLFDDGMMPAAIMPMFKLPIVGQLLQIGFYANPSKLVEVKKRFGDKGKGFRIINTLGQDTLLIGIPVIAFDAYKTVFYDNLQDCVFCFPPISQAVINTENIQKYSLVNRLLRTKVSTSVPENVLQFFIKMNGEKITSRNQTKNKQLGQQVKEGQTTKMTMF
ncbi:hypothetical protein D7V86_01390 [bacterium D16-51]|nr:hypothetical protein D7V96_03930 [bacterium D16-59]RKI62881.1 hypothetical protein D7V86_01390 [bacterium D16-51]